MAHKFPIEMKAVLDSPQRKKLFGPITALKALGVTAGMVVADIGCGTGFFTVPLTVIVGPKGKVFAVDISGGMITDIKNRIEKDHLRNVTALLSRENRIPLKSKTLDYCLLSSVAHELEDEVLFFKELKRLLKDNGKIGIIEWKKISSPLGPPVREKIPIVAMGGILTGNGFNVIKTISLGRYNYGIVATFA